MDAQQIHNLFDEQKLYKKYIKKDLIRVYDQNNNAGITNPKFTCHTLTNKLIDYADAFFIFKGTISRNDGTALAANDDIGINNCAIFKSCKCSFNNNEIEHNRVPELSTTWLNLLEYSPDYAGSVATQYAFVKDDALVYNGNAGATLRREIVEGNIVAGGKEITVVIPLKDLFQFFRRLTFPIINQLLHMEFELNNHTRSIIRHNLAAASLAFTSITFYAPEVVLPSEINRKFLTNLESGKMVKTLHWDAAEYPLQNTILGAAGDFDVLFGTNLVGIRKVLCTIRNNPNNQDQVQSTSDCAITNFNFEIDSKDLFNMNVQTDHEAYRLLSECFNSQGKDVNTGSLIPFNKWKTVYRIYGFDISRQEIFESDPGAIQTIRFRGTSAAGGQMFVILLKNKTTEIDMSNPSNTRTV